MVLRGEEGSRDGFELWTSTLLTLYRSGLFETEGASTLQSLGKISSPLLCSLRLANSVNPLLLSESANKE